MNFDLIDLGKPGGEKTDGPQCLDSIQNCKRLSVSGGFIEHITAGSRNKRLSPAWLIPLQNKNHSLCLGNYCSNNSDGQSKHCWLTPTSIRHYVDKTHSVIQAINFTAI